MILLRKKSNIKLMLLHRSNNKPRPNQFKWFKITNKTQINTKEKRKRTITLKKKRTK